MTRFKGPIGNALIVIGVALIVGTGLMYAYGQYEEAQVERDLALVQQYDAATSTAIALAHDVATAQARAAPSATPTLRVAVGLAKPAAAGPAAPALAATPTAATTATAMPPPIIRRVVA